MPWHYVSPLVMGSGGIMFLICSSIHAGYGDSVDNTVEENSSIFSLIRMLVAVSKGMRAVKLQEQFLTGGAG